MFYYKKYFMNDWCYYASEKEPKNKDGLIEITEDEYILSITNLAEEATEIV